MVIVPCEKQPKAHAGFFLHAWAWIFDLYLWLR